MGRLSRDKRDAYYRLAKEEGYRARAAYKLVQLDGTLDLLREARVVVDLCAAPGGWSQVVTKEASSLVVCVAVDLKEMASLGPKVTMIEGDVTAESTKLAIFEATGGQMADLVLCDGAPDVYGLHDMDDYMQTRLAIVAFDLAKVLLRHGGSFATKIYRGDGGSSSFFKDILGPNFQKVLCAKPRCSRAASVEAFAVGIGFFKEGSKNVNNTDRMIPFVACGSTSDLDADSSYPLGLFADYVLRDPVQLPINPPHLWADQRKRSLLPKEEILVQPLERRASRLAVPRDFKPDASVPLQRDNSGLPAPATDAVSLAAWLTL